MKYDGALVSIYVIPSLICFFACITLSIAFIFNGSFKSKNILFSLLCIWWSALPLLSVLHYILNDVSEMLIIERSVHFAFVFVMPVSVFFYHDTLNIRRKFPEAILFVICSLVAISTPANNYISGFYHFKWGYAAKSGIVSQVFWALNLAAVIYGIVINFKGLKKENNPSERKAIKYFIFALFMSALLICLNFPVIMGVNFYPFVNLMFIPLFIMGYGGLNHQLMDVKRISKVAFIRAVEFLLILIPNILIFVTVHPYIIKLDRIFYFTILTIWFCGNYLLLRSIQSCINKIIDKNKYRPVNDEIILRNNIISSEANTLPDPEMSKELDDITNNLELAEEARAKEIQNKNYDTAFNLRLAGNLQRVLSPHDLPFNEHIRIAAKIDPLMEAGKCFYDVVETGRDKAAIIIVEVSGHGVVSALLCPAIKAEIENELKESDAHTGEICGAVNFALSSSLMEAGLYFTMFLCIIDICEMELEYTGCGSSSFLIVSGDGKIQELSADGYIIGASPDVNFESKKIKLKQADRIFLYSGGITNARALNNEIFGENRLIDSVQKNYPLPLRDQLENILSEVKEFQGGDVQNGKSNVSLVIAEIGSPVQSLEPVREALYHYNKGEYAEALQFIDGIDDSRLSPQYLYIFSKIYNRAGRYDESLNLINRALIGDPSNKEYLYFKDRILSGSANDN